MSWHRTSLSRTTAHGIVRNRGYPLPVSLAFLLGTFAFGVPGGAAQERFGEIQEIALPQEASASGDPDIREWEVPWSETRPRDPYVAPDGKVWFVGQRGHYVAWFDPGTERFGKHDLEDGTGPHNLVVDADGGVWYAGNLARHVGRVDPVTGDIEKIMMPDERARDPHTLVLDREGHIWFTVQAGNFIGRLNMESGEVLLLEAPETSTSRGFSSSRPYGIKLDANGDPWVALFNTNVIVRVDTDQMELRTYELPRRTRPRRLEVTKGGRVWYADYARGRLGSLDPETGEVEEFETPGGERSRPYGMAMDHLERIWFVETGLRPNRFVGFDPRDGSFFSVTELESGGGTVRHMVFHPPTHSIWFGTDANTLARAVVPEGRGPGGEGSRK